jgi:hypothetical protein
MMEYRTRHLVAARPMRYLGEELEVGSPFEATEVDADYLTRNGRAYEAPPAPPPAPAPPPVAERRPVGRPPRARVFEPYPQPAGAPTPEEPDPTLP